MKKKFYNVGTLLYVRNMKCGVEVAAAIAGGLLAAGGSVAAAGINSSAQANINAENEELTRDSWHMQERWMNEQMDFNLVEAEKARDWQSEEAAIQRDFSEHQALLQRQFESEEAAKARDWNAVDAQIQRAKDAGVNPAFYINNGFPTSNVTAGGAAAQTPSVPSTSPSSAVGSPTPAVIPKQAPNLGALSHLGEIANTMSDVALKGAQTKKVNEETKSTITYNQFQAALHQAKLKVDDATSAKMFADVKQIESYIDEIHAKIAEIKANTALIGNEAKVKEIEAFFKSDEMKANIDLIKSKTNWNDKMIDYYFAKLPYELGVMSSESALNYANSTLANMRSQLTEHEISQVDAITSLYKTENANALIDYTVKRTYDLKNAKEEYNQNVSQSKKMEYESSDAVMIIGTTSQVLNSVSGIAGAGAQVGAAAKYIKGGVKPSQVRGFR